MRNLFQNKGELSGLTYTFNQDWTPLNSDAFKDTFYKQHKVHHDYFHHPSVQKLCFEIFSKDENCYLLSVYKGDRLVGYMGFREAVRRMRYMQISCLVPIVSSVSEYNFPVVEPAYLDKFYEILNVVLEKHNLYIEHVPGFFNEYFKKYLPKSFVRHTVTNPCISQNNELIKFSKKKSELNKKRRILRDYNLCVEHLNGNISKELMDVFFDMHIARWKRSGINSNFRQEKYRELYYRLVNLQVEGVGEPIINCLKIDGEYLAIDLGFLLLDGKQYLAQILSSKLTEKTASTGAILYREIVEYTAKIGVENFNLGVGMESYKFRYMNEVMTCFTIVKVNHNVKALLQRATLK
ncbi:GNAT family N-acetyltransferase [Flavobacteriaceae bacterium F08102]|nr:GNAT family N-acetyltransferase [Flavobacteriaceae bacterium F08102]